MIPEYHATFGELSPTVKHALSHRGRAIAKLRPVIRKHMACRRTAATRKREQARGSSGSALRVDRLTCG